MLKRALSAVGLVGFMAGILTVLAMPREAKTQGTDSGGFKQDHMDVVGEKYFQKMFSLARDGRGLKGQTVVTVPAGKVAVIEYVSAQASAGVHSLQLEVQTFRGMVSSTPVYIAPRIPLSLTQQAPPTRMPLSCSQMIRAYSGPGMPIKIQFTTESTGRSEAYGIISGYLVPEK